MEYVPLGDSNLTLTYRMQPVVTAPALTIKPVSSEGLTGAQIFMGHLGNAHVHMWGSVAPSSRQTYATGWARWRQFANIVGTGYDMEPMPLELGHWVLEGLSWPEAFVIAFLSYLRDGHDNHRVIEPSAASNYLSGARFFLRNHNVDTAFVDGSEAIKTVKKGMMLSFRALEGNKMAYRAILPFTLDLIAQCVTHILSRHCLMDSFTAMALKLGIGCLFRKGEYIKTRTADHHLRAMDVTFGLELTAGSIAFMSAHRARDQLPHFLREVIIFVRSAKNDFEGVGNKIAFKVRDITPTVPFCLASDMFAFNAMARPEATQPFLSYRGEWCYDVSHLNLAMKATAARAGLDPDRFESKSLRIAGACILASNNIPSYVIKMAGRWKSDVFMRYIRYSVRTHELIASTIFSFESMSFDDVRRVAPGAGTEHESPHPGEGTEQDPGSRGV